jgi:hypothetical protein
MSQDSLRAKLEGEYIARRNRCADIKDADRPGIIEKKFQRLAEFTSVYGATRLVSKRSEEATKDLIRWLMFSRDGSPQWTIELKGTELYSQVTVTVSETEPLVCNVSLYRSGKNTSMSLAVALKPHTLNERSVSASSLAANGEVAFYRALSVISERSVVFLKNLNVDDTDEVKADSMLSAVIHLLIGVGMIHERSWVVCDRAVYRSNTEMLNLFSGGTLGYKMLLDGPVAVGAVSADGARAHGFERRKLEFDNYKRRKYMKHNNDRRTAREARQFEEAVARRRAEKESKASCVVQ